MQSFPLAIELIETYAYSKQHSNYHKHNDIMSQHPFENTSLIKGRSAGVLLHISSLPSDHGIGDMGTNAYRFAEQLSQAGQKYWQILPLNPSNPGAGESPYFSSSAFAGNPLLIDLHDLEQEGLLDSQEIRPLQNLPATEVDFDQVRSFKLAALKLASQRLIKQGLPSAFETFCKRQAYWLDDFAHFTAISQYEDTATWSEWPKSLRDREPNAMAHNEKLLASEILREKILQFFFFRQWQALKNHCNSLGLVVFGDMPIYVSYESADVWANPEVFKLDEHKRPTMVSGVPPDFFSETGQLWNNPVYNWDILKQRHYDWWVQRMGALFERFDIVRIDHFRGLLQFWEVPAGSENALPGHWTDVPGYELFDTLIEAYPHFPVVVEDLGIITPDVVALKQHYDLPGMLILQFAFYDDNHDNPYKPENHTEHALVYIGSHDNTTGQDWLDNADESVWQRLNPHLKSLGEADQLKALIRLSLNSPANIAILTAQDLLALPGYARMNDPATPWGNWRWRLTQEEFDALPMAWLKDITDQTQRTYRK